MTGPPAILGWFNEVMLALVTYLRLGEIHSRIALDTLVDHWQALAVVSLFLLGIPSWAYRQGKNHGHSS